MASPSISVVVTCFNYGRFVSSAIESVLSQRYRDVELLVINDGSKDDSLRIIRQYSEHARIIDQPNIGHIASCHEGVAETKGDIIVFLDADDRLEPDALASVAAAWNEGCAKVQYDLRIIDGEGRDLGRRFCHFPKGYDAARVRESFRRTGTYRWPVTVGNAYSRWFIEKIFPLDVEHGPDGYLNTVAPVYGDIATIPRPLGCYRVHGMNRWSSRARDDSRLPIRIRDRLLEVDFMRHHARQRGVTVPETNVLDYELAFLNYRMLALALGMDYEGSSRDSQPALFARACRLLMTEPYPFPLRVGHIAWLFAVMSSPRELVKRLMLLRHSRSEIARTLRMQFDRSSRRTQGAG